MTINRPVEFPVTWNQVAAFRLSRHHLLERAPANALVSVAGDIAGVQAQLLSAAQLSLWTRVRDLQVANIEKALSEQTLVKAACMRQTQFLVPPEQLAIFVRGSARRAEKDIRWTRGKGVPDRIIDAAIDAALVVLDQPRTRPEIAERVSRALGVQVQAIHGGVGWGSRRKVAAVPVGDINFPVVYLLHLVATRDVVCSGPNLRNEPTFVRAAAWIPAWQDVPREQAEVALLRKYLHAFGPATVTDFAIWTGMTLTEARSIWIREQFDFLRVNVEGWMAEVLREDLEALTHAGFVPPLIRFLPYFDTFLLGHKERDHLVNKEQQPLIYRTQGWIAPVILVDGRALAIWEYARKGDILHVKITKLGAISQPIMIRIQEEANNLSRFLGVPYVDIQMN
jgi:hypothetical protein